MKSSIVKRASAGAFMLILGAAVMLPLAAQEAAKKGPAKGRLPAYFGDVVDDDERQKIYDIQAAYEPKIEKLENELEALKAERDAKIEKVLPPAKLKKVEEARAAAAAKRDKKDDIKKVEEKKFEVKKLDVKK